MFFFTASLRNHTDKWCQQNCNPDSVPELRGINSQICEQLFKKINRHKNCLSMNEARFFLFFLYLYEIHNLECEGMTILADPREEFKWQSLQDEENEVEGMKSQSAPRFFVRKITSPPSQCARAQSNKNWGPN